MRKGFLFLISSVLALTLAGCSDEKEKDKVKDDSNYEEDAEGSKIKEAKANFVFTRYIKNLYADDLNGKQISMEDYMYANENFEVVDDEYYRKDILSIGKTQDASGVLTYDFEASRYDNSIPRMTNVTTYKMTYDGTTFTATHPSLPGFEFEDSADIDLETARDYFDNYSFKESTNNRFVDILTEDLDYFNIPVEDVKETADGYTGIHKGQFEFTGGVNEGGIGDITFQVSLDKEYNFTGVKSVMSYDGKILREMTIQVTDFK